MIGELQYIDLEVRKRMPEARLDQRGERRELDDGHQLLCAVVWNACTGMMVVVVKAVELSDRPWPAASTRPESAVITAPT